MTSQAVLYPHCAVTQVGRPWPLSDKGRDDSWPPEALAVAGALRASSPAVPEGTGTVIPLQGWVLRWSAGALPPARTPELIGLGPWKTPSRVGPRCCYCGGSNSRLTQVFNLDELEEQYKSL